MLDPREVDHMARLRDIMNGNSSSPMPKSLNEQNNKTPEIPSVDIHSDMKGILSRMYEANGMEIENSPATPIMESSTPSYDDSYTSSIYEDIIENSGYFVKVGLREGSKTSRTYSVLNGSHTAISDINLFETAYIISQFLNEGYDLKSSKVNNILDLEREYKVAVKECHFFKSKLNRCKQLNESAAGEVFSEKFKSSKAKAESAHGKLKARLASL